MYKKVYLFNDKKNELGYAIMDTRFSTMWTSTKLLV